MTLLFGREDDHVLLLDLVQQAETNALEALLAQVDTRVEIDQAALEDVSAVVGRVIQVGTHDHLRHTLDR